MTRHLRPTGRRSIRTLLAAMVAALGLVLLVSGQASAATNQPAVAYATLNGSGSSWAQPAIDKWSSDVRPRGIVVNYNGNGSQQGRSDFTQTLSDFAGSDIAFLNGQDKIAGGQVENSQYGYSYVPITAGGTAFMYHLTVAGKQVRDLRLSGETLTKIFTGVITNWSDPQITKDYGAQLPNKPIVPVVRSDGSGATAQFTAWMNQQYPSLWNAFCARSAHVTANPCGETEFYPTFGNSKAQGSSVAVANYISASFGEGTIGYDEYAYAKGINYPVVKLLNPAGFYTLPTAQNVAVALTQAVINQDTTSIDYLTQDLRKVYTNPDPRSYPLSSYSYLIIPRTSAKPNPGSWSAGKGASMSAYADYFLCAGQQEMDKLGYSPLPVNLVQGAFSQIAAMPFAQPTPASQNLAACNNPTFQGGKNVLLLTAPQPSPCDKATAPLSCTTGGGSASNGKNNTGNSGSGGANTGASVDPNTGQVVSGGSSGGGTSGGGTATAQTVLVSSASNDRWFPAVAAGLAVIGAVALPPTLSLWARRRRRT
jgi:ABC-type phosphate transport system substrate-binding protein